MNQALFNSSRGRLLRLLRRSPQSVNELAEALGVTDNAIRSALARLQRDGLVRQSGKRPGFRKPELIYDITEQAEHLFDQAWMPAFENLLAMLESHLSGSELDEKLCELGRRMAAPHLQAMKDFSFDQRARATLEILQDLGGLAEFSRRDDQAFVIGFGCPFSKIVEAHPKLCRVVQAFVAELLDCPVQEQCQRGERSKCCFALE